MGSMRSVLLLLAVLCTSAACRDQSRLPEPVNIALPRAIDGRPWSFADRRSEATIVFFFSTWCVPCQAMEPFVAEAARIGPREGIEVIGVALDVAGNKTVAPYVQATEPPYPVLLGGGAIAEGRSPFGRIPSLPSVIFLDGDGRPSAVIQGLVDTELLMTRAREVRSRTD